MIAYKICRLSIYRASGKKVNKSYLDYLALRNVPVSVSDAIAFVTFVLWSLLQAPRPSTNEL